MQFKIKTYRKLIYIFLQENILYKYSLQSRTSKKLKSGYEFP